MPYFALLDDVVSGRAVLFQNLQYSDRILSDDLNHLDGLLAQGWRRGLHLFLTADYGFGLPLQNLLATESGTLALHWFADKQNVDAAEWLAAQEDGSPAGISQPEISRGHTEYLNDIAEIQAAIARGDCYQINHTVRLHLSAYGDPVRLYRRLRQPVPYAALACLPDENNGQTWTLCFSPELFLNIRSDGLIATEPMKGTAPILNDGCDAERAATLQSDPKNRAENVMIVDLLRNDLGKIAQTGGVRVPEPFKVSPFGGVWQMTSRIEAQAKAGTSAADIFRAAFPCGSITGAPKRKSHRKSSGTTRNRTARPLHRQHRPPRTLRGWTRLQRHAQRRHPHPTTQPLAARKRPAALPRRLRRRLRHRGRQRPRKRISRMRMESPLPDRTPPRVRPV